MAVNFYFDNDILPYPKFESKIGELDNDSFQWQSDMHKNYIEKLFPLLPFRSSSMKIINCDDGSKYTINEFATQILKM